MTLADGDVSMGSSFVNSLESGFYGDGQHMDVTVSSIVEEGAGTDLTHDERETIMEKFGLKTPSVNLLLSDVPGLEGSVELLMFHAALRLVEIPDGVPGVEAIRKERSTKPQYIGRVELPVDYGRTGAGELAAEAFLKLEPGLVKVSCL